ncbi:MAG: hypothetical protein GX049_06275 [Alcaligenaceae bacterium]|nr:hypothetical protein [Alcaligenaceae bacterium]
MFGSSKRNTFKPTAYGSSRRKRRIPRWLLLILTGIVLGAGGLLFMQKSYGPQRLTVEQSEQLHYDLTSANNDKQRLQAELSQQGRELAQVRERLEAQTRELETGRKELQAVKDHIALFIDAMPPDPRGTSPGVNAATFTFNGDTLNYAVLVMQDKDKAAKTFNGILEMSLAGRYPNGRNGTIELDPIDLTLNRYMHLEGSLPIPDGLKPRQVVVKILDANTRRQVATRTLNVR